MKQYGETRGGGNPMTFAGRVIVLSDICGNLPAATVSSNHSQKNTNGELSYDTFHPFTP
jgi:hypothetical protein